jgi:hypothetical protein
MLYTYWDVCAFTDCLNPVFVIVITAVIAITVTIPNVKGLDNLLYYQ